MHHVGRDQQQSADWDPSIGSLRWILPVGVTCLQDTASDAGTQAAAHSMYVLHALQSTYP